MKYFTDAGLTLLPGYMDTPEARAMLYAIALQESRFLHRKQIQGPALGFWQFERIGVTGVLTHPVTREIAEKTCDKLRIDPGTEIYSAIRYNDGLAGAFARLLLWQYPGRLPNIDESSLGWDQYRDLWRPGKPRLESWGANFKKGWDLTQSEEKIHEQV